jgi:uncharacterized membrane protein YbaN (DUF454 family)
MKIVRGQLGFTRYDTMSRNITIDEVHATVRVHEPQLFCAGRRAFCERLVELASAHPKFRSAEIDLDLASCRLTFGPGLADTAALAEAFAQAVRGACDLPPRWERAPLWRREGDWLVLTAERHEGRIRRHRRRDSRSGAPVVSGPSRVVNLVLAGGSFGMTLVAFVVPGIPTVPFLLATGYYLARSSPRLDTQLRKTPVFGKILREWEQHQALSCSSKDALTGLTLVIVAITAVVAAFDPLTMVVVVLMSAISLYGIARMPEIGAESRALVVS